MSKLWLGAALLVLLTLTGCVWDGTRGAADEATAGAQAQADDPKLSEKPSEPTVPGAQESQKPPNAPSTGATTPSANIDEAQAQEIALEHAGYSAEEAQWLRVERDHDHGRLEYEVEFYVGRTEYNYEIDATDGTILSYEADQEG
jgi:uncharacterized membrane protein YkoI